MVRIPQSPLTRTLKGRRNKREHDSRHKAGHGNKARGASDWLWTTGWEVTDCGTEELTRDEYGHGDGLSSFQEKSGSGSYVDT